MIYLTKELLKSGETEYSIRCKVKEGSLRQLQRGVYSSEKKHFLNESDICKKYSEAVLTGLSAFYIYDLTDHIPDYFYLSTKQHSFPIRRKDVKQSYQDRSFFDVGVVTKEIDCGTVKIYDLERMLIELFRLKEKYPKDLYYEVLSSFRKIKDNLDFYRVNSYLKSFSNGKNLLLKIKESI